VVTVPNAELAYKVLDHIDAHPEQWRQQDWISRPDGADCGTAACFAGWACLLSGDTPRWEFPADELTERVNTTSGVELVHDVEFVNDRAAYLLGISLYEADSLFDAENERDGIVRLVTELFGPRPRGAA
jgi:hypothetical protein